MTKGKLVVSTLYEYSAQTDQELSFAEGILLIITDDSDPEWWDAKLISENAFSEKTTGLVPATYVEPASQISKYIALYDYEARTDEELSFQEGALIYVYDTEDPEWWLALCDREVGLVPDVLKSEVSSTAPHVKENAIDQKQAFLGVLDGLGFASVRKSSSSPTIASSPLKANSVSIHTPPTDIKYYPITEIDKKKKKNNRKGTMGMSDDFIVYFIHDGAIAQQFNYIDISKYSERKGRKLVIEHSGNIFEYEGEKADVQAIFTFLEEAKTKSKMSRPIMIGNPPFIGVDVHQQGQSIETRPSPQHNIPPTSSQSPVHFAEAKIAIALYNYVAQNEEEISIQEKDNLIVMDDSDPDWTMVKIVSKNGGQGYVPASYIELKPRLVENPVPTISSIDQGKEFIAKERIPIIMPRPKIEDRPSPVLERPLQLPPPIAGRPAGAPLIAERPLERAQTPVRRPSPISDRPDAIPPPIGNRPVERPPVISNRPAQSVKLPPISNRPSEISPAIGNRPTPQPSLPARPNNVRTPTLIVELKCGTYTVYSASASSEFAADPGIKKGCSHHTRPQVRQWTDKSGTFKVEAQYIGLADGKVQLHKLNGVKIMVPLDKLCARDTEYVSKIPGNERLQNNASIASSGAPRKAAVISGPALLKASESTTNNQYTHNAFDWKSWLIAANVDAADAQVYAVKFVEQKMDKSALVDLEREVLRVLGVAEGDIIRIRKAVGHMPGVPSQVEKERLAQERNMQLLGSLRQKNSGASISSNSRPSTSSPSAFPTTFGNTSQQLKSDEAYARELQNEELRNRVNGSTRSSTTRDNFDINTLQQAKDILQANNQREAAEALAAVAISSTTEKKRPDYANPSNDPWSTLNGRSSVESTASSINPSSSVSQRPISYANSAPVSQMSPYPPSGPLKPSGPLIAPLVATPVSNTHNIFVPTNLGNHVNTYIPSGLGNNAGYGNMPYNPTSSGGVGSTTSNAYRPSLILMFILASQMPLQQPTSQQMNLPSMQPMLYQQQPSLNQPMNLQGMAQPAGNRFPINQAALSSATSNQYVNQSINANPNLSYQQQPNRTDYTGANMPFPNQIAYSGMNNSLGGNIKNNENGSNMHSPVQGLSQQPMMGSMTGNPNQSGGMSYASSGNSALNMGSNAYMGNPGQGGNYISGSAAPSSASGSYLSGNIAGGMGTQPTFNSPNQAYSHPQNAMQSQQQSYQVNPQSNAMMGQSIMNSNQTGRMPIMGSQTNTMLPNYNSSMQAPLSGYGSQQPYSNTETGFQGGGFSGNNNQSQDPYASLKNVSSNSSFAAGSNYGLQQSMMQQSMMQQSQPMMQPSQQQLMQGVINPGMNQMSMQGMQPNMGLNGYNGQMRPRHPEWR